MNNLITKTNQTDGVMATGNGIIHTIVVTPDGTATVVKIYDGPDANGTLMYHLVTSATVTLEMNDQNVAFSKGIYVDVDSHTAYLGITVQMAETFTVQTPAALDA